MTTLDIPALSLVVLVGPSGSGKSTFAARHFKPSEVLSSDALRGMVRDDPNDQSASADAFEVLHTIARKRLAAGLLTVVDATNVQHAGREALVALAREQHVLPVAIVLDLPREACIERNDTRPDRPDSARYVMHQHADMRRSLKGPQGKGLFEEGFRKVFVLHTPAEVDAVEIERERLYSDRRDETGPFDCIGDVHGCFDELSQLLARLGYSSRDGVWGHPEGRRAVFLGDLVDRGPRSLDVLRLVRRMCQDGAAVCVQGNHDAKFLRALDGRDVQRQHGLERTMAELEALSEEERAAFHAEARPFLYGLTSHYVFDGGRLVVAHAGMKQAYQGRNSTVVRTFALFGETTGEVDEYGLPVRANWAADYRGDAYVVYGHTPTTECEWVNRTMCIDTGCVFGGKLTALRYPEMVTVSVPAAQVYYEPKRPLREAPADARTAQQAVDDALRLDEVLGRRTLSTRWLHTIPFSDEESAAALEAMSRFALDPRWLIYLPPTMSPTEASQRPDLLEHPDEAFAHYRKMGVPTVICQQKHMGSRAVAIVLRSPEVAERRFGLLGHSGHGVLYTRTGRAFFDDTELEQGLLRRVHDAATAAGLWDALETDWLCLDCELMPWSAKAQELLRRQYAAVGSAGSGHLDDLVAALAQTSARGVPVDEWLQHARDRRACVEGFVEAWRGYCWPVAGLDDLRLAPFHLLAAEGRTFFDRDHVWHMKTLAALAEGDPTGVLVATPWRRVELADEAEVAEAVAWWEALTAAGGEGMVVKPLDFITQGPPAPVVTAHGGSERARHLVQPAVKCRGREYLRIIYGPEYTLPGQLERLRKRGVSSKRTLALKEFALGAEALSRFVAGEPLRRVHECVFGVLALEADPIDPRL